jgi:hypothetical protein
VSKLTRSEAARLNGAKSRGPVTPEGKARSSRNSTKHGLCALTTRTLSGESPDKLEELREMYFERFRPATDYQLQLVEELVSIRWRLRRLPDIETALIDHEMDRQSLEVDKTYSEINDITRVALAFEKLAAGSSGAMQLILRYEAGLRGAYEKNVRALERDQASQAEYANEPEKLPASEGDGEMRNEPKDTAPDDRDEMRNEPDAAQPGACNRSHLSPHARRAVPASCPSQANVSDVLRGGSATRPRVHSGPLRLQTDQVAKIKMYHYI